MIGVWLVLWRVLTTGNAPSVSLSPNSTKRGFMAWYSAVTPSSLKRAAMVPNTGMSSMRLLHASWLRCTCLLTSRKASCEPLRSNLLIATNCAKSSMSIFSSWLAAPNSGVITYMGRFTCGTIAASPWPMPLVSTMIRSKPATLQASITSGRAWLISEPNSRVAKLRINTREPPAQGAMAFIRMRSPSSAPPDLRREGSIDISAMRRLSFWSSRRRRISSSVSDDLPAPPVPVMPITGIAILFEARYDCMTLTMLVFSLDISSLVINCAKLRQASSPWP